MKKRNKRQLNNGGFSLVELLVTILIIGIMSVPMIRSFVVTANVNHKARRIQNATDVAQNIAEYYGNVKLADIIPTIKSDDGSLLVFKDIEERGIDGEKFYVTVVMDSEGFAGYETPNLKNLFGEGGINCYSEFTRYDGRALDYLKETYGYASLSQKDIHKTANVNINVKASGQYEYSVEVIYTVRINSSQFYKTDKMIIESDTATDTNLPNLYLLYKPYDVYVDEAADDVVNIHYTGDITNTRNVNVYMIPQRVNFVDTNGNKDANRFVSFNCSTHGGNVNITYNGASYDPGTGNTKLAYLYNLSNDLTGVDSNEVRFYNLLVYVRYDERDTNTVESYLSRTYNTTDIFTTVSTVREE